MALNQNAPTVFPTLSYDDAEAAIAFLTGAFGMVTGEVARDSEGRVNHAVLGWHHDVIMLSSRRDESSPFNTGKAVLYLVTEDPDALHGKAEAAGAEIVMGLVDQPYGSREFAARDPEGNMWCFGTYQPAAPQPAASR